MHEKSFRPLTVNTLPPRTAGEMLDRDPETIRTWCRQFPAIGVKVGGRWAVREAALRQVAAGVPLAKIRC